MATELGNAFRAPFLWYRYFQSPAFSFPQSGVLWWEKAWRLRTGGHGHLAIRLFCIIGCCFERELIFLLLQHIFVHCIECIFVHDIKELLKNHWARTYLYLCYRSWCWERYPKVQPRLHQPLPSDSCSCPAPGCRKWDAWWIHKKADLGWKTKPRAYCDGHLQPWPIAFRPQSWIQIWWKHPNDGWRVLVLGCVACSAACKRYGRHHFPSRALSCASAAGMKWGLYLG